jgi:hypothetical protein
MDFTPWTLAGDSLIAAAALAPMLRRQHVLPLIGAFGACDAIATMLDVQLPAVRWFGPAFLVLWGLLITFNAYWLRDRLRSPIWAYLLPPLLALDNLIVPGPSPLIAGLYSSLAAAFGFTIGYAVLSALGTRVPKQRWLGAPLSIAGLLLAI